VRPQRYRSPTGAHTPSSDGDVARNTESQDLPKTDLFEGDKPEKAAAFLNLLQVYFMMNPAAYHNDRTRSLFLIADLHEPAEVLWARHYIESDSSSPVNLMITRVSSGSSTARSACILGRTQPGTPS
jgi:hypothetical protein